MNSAASLSHSAHSRAQSVFASADTQSTGTVPLRTLSNLLPFPRDDLLALLEYSDTIVVRYSQFFNWLFDRTDRELNAVSGSTLSQTPAMPVGMTALPEVTPSMQARQRTHPEKWALPMNSWNNVIDHCKLLPEYRKIKSNTGFVNLYELNKAAIKPWTNGTGCGLAILMTKESALSAGLMISHCWGEDLEECQAAVNKYVTNRSIPGQTPAWFCIFANYQCQDEVGPSIQAQLDMQPFQSVITSIAESFGYGMVAVHTTREDLYGRLWCVHEVDAALRANIQVGAAMSDDYITETVRRIELFSEFHFDAQSCLQAAGVRVDTVRSRCGNPDDERMLIGIVTGAGGFRRLDAQIEAFRLAVLPKEVKDRLFPPDLYSDVEEDDEETESLDVTPRPSLAAVASAEAEASADTPAATAGADLLGPSSWAAAAPTQASPTQAAEAGADLPIPPGLAAADGPAHRQKSRSRLPMDSGLNAGESTSEQPALACYSRVASSYEDAFSAANEDLNAIAGLDLTGASVAHAELVNIAEEEMRHETYEASRPDSPPPFSDIDPSMHKSDHAHHAHRKSKHAHPKRNRKVAAMEVPWAKGLCRKGSSVSMSSEAEFARMVGRRHR